MLHKKSQALPSLYDNAPDGSMLWNREHVQNVLDGRASINEVTSFMGIFRKFFKEEYKQLRLGTGVANLKVRWVGFEHRKRHIKCSN